MLKFLQISDLHLGAKLTGFPDSIAQQLREATRENLAFAFSEATRNDINIILMPGDLYEAGGTDPSAQLRYVYQLADQVDPVPVVIAPGNHDPFGPDSPYLSESRPANVYLFSAPDFRLVDTPVGPVAGRACMEGGIYDRPDWSGLLPPASGPGLLVMHGSLLTAGDDRRHDRIVAPLTEESLLSSGYAYTALGHYHNQREFRRSGEYAFAAYSGCPQGQGWDECGNKGFVTGILEPAGAILDFVPAAKHVFTKLSLSLPHGIATEDEKRLVKLETGLQQYVESAAALDLRLSGRWPEALRDLLLRRVQQVLDRGWHARPVDLSAVEFHPELAEPGKSEVLDEFFEFCDSGIAASAEDETEAEAWELARHLGHRLLSGQGLPGVIGQ